MMQMQDGVRTNSLTVFIIKDSAASTKRLLLYYFEINNTELFRCTFKICFLFLSTGKVHHPAHEMGAAISGFRPGW